MMGRIYDELGIDIGPVQPVIAPRPLGPWTLNHTVARAQRDADAPVVALVARWPDRLAFVGGKLALVKA